jgi:hypothetical protein
VAVEDSAAVFEHHELRAGGGDKDGKTPPVSKLLSTIFMADWAKRDQRVPNVSYRLQLAVLMPDFQVDKADASENYYEGSKIFSGAAVIELKTDDDPWTATYWWESEAPGSDEPPVVRELALTKIYGGKLEATIPVSSGGAVQLDAAIRFVVSSWQ